MIHIFQAPDDTTFVAEVCDIGLTESPINLSIYGTNSRVTLEVASPGWMIMGIIFDMIEESQEEALDQHTPIVDLVASVHWAACAEPEDMGVI